MTLKEIRENDLRFLHSSDKVTPAKYCIDILDSLFIPWEHLEFETPAEANKAYNTYLKAYPPAFVRKYAKIEF